MQYMYDTIGEAAEAVTVIEPYVDEVTTVANNIQAVIDVAAIDTDVTATAGNASDITTVATNIVNVNSVATNISDVITVAGDAAEISAVSSNSVNINIVASADTDIATVSTNIADVNTVAASIDDVGVVAGVTSDLAIVAADSAAITTVADDSVAVNTVSDNIVDVQNAGANAVLAVDGASDSLDSALESKSTANENVDVFTKTYLDGVPTDTAEFSAKHYREKTADDMAITEGYKDQSLAALQSTVDIFDTFDDTFLGAKSTDTVTLTFTGVDETSVILYNSKVTGTVSGAYGIVQSVTYGTDTVVELKHVVSTFDTITPDELTSDAGITISGVDVAVVGAAFEPDVDNDGNPLEAGTIYYNTTTDEVKFYNGASWDAPDTAAAQSALNASNSEIAALYSYWDSEAARRTSDSYATEARDVLVKIHTSNDNGTYTITNSAEYSSLHYAEIASEQITDEAPIDGLPYARQDAGWVEIVAEADEVLEYADFASLPATGVSETIYITADTNYLFRWDGATYAQVGGEAEVIEYTDLESFPATGEAGVIYVAQDTNQLYRWDTTVYVQIGGGEIPNATATVVGGVTAYFDVATGELYLRNDGLDATPVP